MSITIKGRTIDSRHIGLVVVVFALLVTAPRLTLTFIMSDNLKLNQTVEFWTLVISAMAGSVVLTLGNAYLTHVLASHFNRHDPLAWLLAGAWVIYLGFTTVIIAPALMVGVRQSPLAEVLPYLALQWTWCVIAALCFEFLVAGSMAAYAIASRTPTPISTPPTAPLAPLALPGIEVAPVGVPAIPTLDDLDARLLDIYRANPAYPKTQAAQEVGASRQTVSNRLARLQERGLVVVSANGNGTH